MDFLKFLGRCGKSQAEIAKILNTSPANVNRWAKGEGYPSYELCAELLKLGMTIEELFDASTAEKFNAYLKSKEVTQDEITIMVKRALASLAST